MARIRRWLNAIPAMVEFAIVFVLAFGPPIVAAAVSVITGDSEGSISEPGLLGLMIQEAAVLGLLLPFLYLRGWTLQRIGLNASLLDSAIGLLLAFGSGILDSLILAIAGSIWPDLIAAAEHPNFVTPGFSAGTVLAASALNGLFEELFLCGYVITLFKGRGGIWMAINISVAIRLSYHLYQGPIGVLGAVPFGLVFGYFYARTGRLWPLVFAHALVDFLSLMQFIY